MKIKGIIKVILILIITLLFILLNSNVTEAVKVADTGERDNITIEDVTGGAGSFINAGKGENNPLDQEGLKNVSDVVYNILLAVGIIAAVIVGLIIGIKYMTGSVAQKAETKELLTPYIVGCVIIFGAFTIWKIVVELLNQTQV